MECIHCGAQWVLRDGQTKLANCPFCGEALMIEKAEERYTDLSGALKAIVEMKGTEILISKPQTVLGIFLDIANNLKREFRLLKLFYDNKTENFFADSAKITEGQLNMAVRSLQENAFMEIESARHIVNVFAMVLGIKAQVQRTEAPFPAEEKTPSIEKALSEEAPLPKEISSIIEEPMKNPLSEGMIAAVDLKKGAVIEWEGGPYQIVDILHVRPGRGADFIRTKLKHIKNGGVTETAFRPTEIFARVQIEKRKMQYLFSDAGQHVFMDLETYDQINVNDETVGNTLKYIVENEIAIVNSYEGEVFSVEPPFFVDREVIETQPGFKGDTATGSRKPATIETGEVIQVPMFIDKGDRIKIDTHTGEYLSRV